MKNVRDGETARHFIAWQCRLRQIAMREAGGRPSAGMMPQVSLASGEVIVPSMAVLLVPVEPEEATRLFEFQARKSNDPRQVYEAGLKVLQAGYFQQPQLFRDSLVAQFAEGSQVAGTLVEAADCLLTFEQFSQAWILACTVSELEADDPVRGHTLAHNRIFNPKGSAQATVLSFAPVWAKAQAQPMPPGLN